MSSAYAAYKLNTKDLPTTNSQQVKLPTNTNEEAPCPSSPTKQGQVSCTDFGQPMFTIFSSLITHRNDNTQLSTYSTDPQPNAEFTQLRAFYYPEASMKGRKQPKTYMYSHAN